MKLERSSASNDHRPRIEVLDARMLSSRFQVRVVPRDLRKRRPFKKRKLSSISYYIYKYSIHMCMET